MVASDPIGPSLRKGENHERTQTGNRRRSGKCGDLAMGKDAQELADMYFFETLVRIHRAGEGVAYTGLKPAMPSNLSWR